MIKIKPHHFIDIIKLYGKGISNFVPNTEYKHNFYSVANEIISNHGLLMELTIHDDDICLPCKYINNKGICIDSINHIDGVISKDQWNKILDKRIMNYTNLVQNTQISAYDFCILLYSIRNNIFDIWKEESDSSKKERYDAFCSGAKKYLNIL